MAKSGIYTWLYRGKRPNWLAKLLNGAWAAIHAWGVAPNYLVTLDVVGRKSGKVLSLPLVMVVKDGQRYLVSMFGSEAQWVLNAKASDYKAVLRSGKREAIQLVDVPVEQRAPLLKAYLQRAPGARPHIPVSKDAPLSAFEEIAGDFPVFRVVTTEST